MARSAKSVGRHKKSKSVRRRQRAGVATAVMMTAAMGATVGAGAGQAAEWYDPILDLLPIESCEGGSGTVNANVDCTWTIDPPVTGLLPVLGLDVDLNSGATARKDITIPIWLFPDIEVGGTNAKISGVGLAYANSLLAAPGSSAEANAWGFLSGAVAVTLPPDSLEDFIAMEPGHTKATSLPLGVTIAAAGSGEATAFAMGGFATAIGFTDLIENVSCMALVSYASHSDVGTCVGLLFIFSVTSENGTPGYTFAIADPTSLQLLSSGSELIPLPIPSFARDILRVNFGGPGGISFESDLVPPTTTTLASARVAAAPEPSITAVADESEPAPESEQTYVGKHRAAEPVAEEEPAEPLWTEPAPAAEAEPEAEPEPTVVTEKPDTTPSTSTPAPSDTETSTDAPTDEEVPEPAAAVVETVTDAA